MYCLKTKTIFDFATFQLLFSCHRQKSYHLKIEIDSDRKATVFVNGVQYNLTSTAGSTGGTSVTAVQPGVAATKTAALTDDVDLIPYVGIEAGAAAAEAVNVHHVCMSRNVYE